MTRNRIARTALAIFLIAAAARALEVPPPPAQWFTDRAAIVPAAQADALNRKLADFEQQSGAQFLIYVFPSLEGEVVEDFTIRAVERWKVGQKKYDNGLVLFVFVRERKVRIEVGYGLEGAVTDAYASRVIREYIAPYFQRGDYAGGLNAGADALMARIRKEEPPVPPLRPRGQQGPESFDFPGVLFLIILFVVIFFILPRTGCSGCFWPMFFLPRGGGGVTFGGGGGFSGGGGFGGFSGGGGSFGGGGATGGW